MALALRRLASGVDAAAEASASASCEAEAAHRRLAGGGGGPSIFELDYGYVDSIHFWLAFVGMIFFCVLVDRTQALLDHCAEGSPTNERFLQKVYTELLMFGVVAVTLFVSVQITTSISARAMTTITFIDVLCSMGACGLIAIAGILSTVRFVYWQHWVSCEHVDRKKDSLIETSESKLVACERAMEHAWAHAFCVTKPAHYSDMSRLFKRRHKTPIDFKYHLYLAEVLTRECCELMSINWASWIALLSAGGMAILVELIYTEPPSFNSYIFGMTCLNWSLMVSHLVLLFFVRNAFSRMISGLSSGDDFSDGVSPKWGERPRWALQVLQLFNSFCFAFYLMHGKYNLRCKSAAYDLMLIAPLLVNILILLPLTLPQLVLVDGFFLLDASALDSVLAERQQADEDLRYMLNRWAERGCPDFNSGNSGGLTLSAFEGVMSLLGMHASPSRIKRIFTILDSDKSGTIDIKELLKRLRILQGEEDKFSKDKSQDISEEKQACSANEEKQAIGVKAVPRIIELAPQMCTPRDGTTDIDELLEEQASDEGQLEQKASKASTQPMTEFFTL